MEFYCVILSYFFVFFVYLVTHPRKLVQGQLTHLPIYPHNHLLTACSFVHPDYTHTATYCTKSSAQWAWEMHMPLICIHSCSPLLHTPVVPHNEATLSRARSPLASAGSRLMPVSRGRQMICGSGYCRYIFSRDRKILY